MVIVANDLDAVVLDEVGRTQPLEDNGFDIGLRPVKKASSLTPPLPEKTISATVSMSGPPPPAGASSSTPPAASTALTVGSAALSCAMVSSSTRAKLGISSHCPIVASPSLPRWRDCAPLHFLSCSLHTSQVVCQAGATPRLTRMAAISGASRGQPPDQPSARR